MNYRTFIAQKNFKNNDVGFDPLWIPDFLFDFQKTIVTWALQKGRAALFEDCGLGKTPQQLVWAENVIRKTNKRVLIVTPLAVSHQTLREAEKFGVEAKRSADGRSFKGITVTNYERLSKFNPKDYVGLVADESSILKHSDAMTRKLVTEFSRSIRYRLLCTATPAPNDFMELGTSSEALGMMTHPQMLAMFFTHCGDRSSQWELKGHAKHKFWEWMSTWARAIRKPSDLGFDDGKFELPALNCKQHIIESKVARGSLIVQPAVSLDELRAERVESLEPRCSQVVDLVREKPHESWVIWTHLNAEADLIERSISGSVQVKGSMTDDEKEERFIGFVEGRYKILITKPKIGGFGMNWQHCHNITYFPDDSYEKFYQCIRRCWRFGQTKPVKCHIVSSTRQSRVVLNMLRKERQVNEMYDGIIRNMTEFQLNKKNKPQLTEKVRIPQWL